MEFLTFATGRIARNLAVIVLIVVTVLAACFFGFVFLFMWGDAGLQARYDGLWTVLKALTAGWCLTAVVLGCWISYPAGGWDTRAAKVLSLAIWALTLAGGMAPLFFV